MPSPPRSSCLFLLLRPAMGSTLFPYTTLFRSSRWRARCRSRTPRPASAVHPSPRRRPARPCPRRSEEHTSELQSHSDLVCRLLLEKKKDQWELQSSIEKLGILQPITVQYIESE